METSPLLFLLPDSDITKMPHREKDIPMQHLSFESSLCGEESAVAIILRRLWFRKEERLSLR